jgi:hypothetical protein
MFIMSKQHAEMNIQYLKYKYATMCSWYGLSTQVGVQGVPVKHIRYSSTVRWNLRNVQAFTVLCGSFVSQSTVKW